MKLLMPPELPAQKQPENRPREMIDATRTWAGSRRSAAGDVKTLWEWE